MSANTATQILPAAQQAFWTIEVPVLSTALITRQTSERLTSLGDRNPWAQCACYEDGYFISVPEVAAFPPDIEEPPEDLLAILKWARERGYPWVRLDSIGDIVDGLPSYSW